MHEIDLTLEPKQHQVDVDDQPTTNDQALLSGRMNTCRLPIKPLCNLLFQVLTSSPRLLQDKMRLSVILLVVAAFVATLDPTAAASDANTVVAAANVHESIPSARFLRARHEDDYPVKDELDEEDSDDDKKNDEERMFSFFGEKATALSAFKTLVAKSGDDLVEAVSNLTKAQFQALFNQGQSHMAKMVPGFHSGMSLDEFGTAVRAARLDDDLGNALMLGYGKYLAHKLNE